MPVLEHLCSNQHTTLEAPSFTDFKDTVGGAGPDHAHWGLVCHPKVSI